MSNYFDNKELFLQPKTNQYGSHMIMSNVMKESKIKYINIDTRFRDEYNYNAVSNYNITLPQRLNEVHNISITNVEIPNTFFNISGNLGNNSFKITSGATVKTITVADGYYNQTTLKTAINNAITAAGSPFSSGGVAFDIVGNYSSFAPTALTATINFDVDPSGNFNKYNFKSRLGWLLGFRNQSYTFSSKITSECFVDLTGSRYLYLVVDEFSAGNQSSFVSPLPTSIINKNILGRISLDPQTYPYLSVIPANLGNGLLLSDARSYTGKVNLQKINVQLINEYGIVMNLNGADFSFCLRVEHE